MHDWMEPSFMGSFPSGWEPVSRPFNPTELATGGTDGLQEIVKRPEWPDIMSRLYAWEDMAPTDDSAYDPVRDAVQYFGLELDECARTTTLSSETGGFLAHAGDDGLTTTIQVPPDAVSDTTQLSFSPIDAVTHVPAGLVEIDHAFDLTAVISGTTQTVTSLTTAYSLTVPYLPSQLQGTPEEELGLYWWDGSAWLKDPTSQVDAIGNTVSAAPDHFSFFAVLGSNRVFLPLTVKG